MTQTLFVAGATGFIGSHFVRHALRAGYHLTAITRSAANAEALRAQRIEVIIGDLLASGEWQHAAARADAVVHIAQPLTFGGRVTRARAETYRRERLKMDLNLLTTLMGSAGQRIVYVSGTSYYGDLGAELHDETATPKPKGWGPYIIEALAQVRAFRERGLNIVEAFPGQIYGAGSWYKEMVATLIKGTRLAKLGARDKYGSFMYVEDTGRAILHLLERGTVGERYFLVDDEPSTLAELARLTLAEYGLSLKRLWVPYFALEWLLGPINAEGFAYENRLSNAKLRATGFVPQYPALAQGVPQAVAALRKMGVMAIAPQSATP
jgi:nucleoside-diphosphate-sugar epimerase